MFAATAPTTLARRLPSGVCTMTRTRRLALLFILLLIGPSLGTAVGGPDTYERIRTTDARLAALVDEGVQGSPTFRRLVERLEDSDVVVYLLCEGDARSRIGGRLTFVSAAGGYRDVLVRLAPLEPRSQQIAMLGHELQHAVEIADTPSIVDLPSLARAYERIGHINHSSPSPGIAFDTTAAIAAGRRVLGEVAVMAGD